MKLEKIVSNVMLFDLSEEVNNMNSFDLPTFDLIPLVVLGCLTVGFVLKQSNFLKDKYNQYIPLILAVVGIFLSLWIDNWQITPSNVIYGAISGLASTGLHQAFIAVITGNTKGDGNNGG